MSEDQELVDITPTANLLQTDSMRRFVSTSYPTSGLYATPDQDIISKYPTSNIVPLQSLAYTVDTDLSNLLDKLSCERRHNSTTVNHTKIEVIAEIHNEAVTVKQHDTHAALRSTKPANTLLTSLSVKASQSNLPKTEKRKRDSPQTRNVREKLLQYAYEDKRTKNVHFALQADVNPSNNVEMEPAASNSSSTTSIAHYEARQVRSLDNLETALPQRRDRLGARIQQRTEENQTQPTEEEVRKYQVPNSKEKMWKLLEHQLRTVGREEARISQLSLDLEDDTPPSWCFGGSQVPQHLRPLHPELVNLTHKYATQMAITTRHILIRQQQVDSTEARHLQDTLRRMYKEDGDPNFELAKARAEGIAAHYTRKEEILTRRMAEEDFKLLPETPSEWAEHLARRKSVKPSTRGRSRSRSKDAKSNGNKNKTIKTSNPQRNQNPQVQAPQPHKKPKHHPGNSRQAQHGKHQKNRPSTSYEARAQTSNTSLNPRSVPSYTTQNGRETQRKSHQQSSSSTYIEAQPTNLNAEEQQLIRLLRESKKSNN